MWDARTGQELRLLKDHTDTVMSIVFSRDGKRLVSGSRDKTVKVWDARKAQEVFTLKGHTDIVKQVGFSADERYLIGIAENGKKLVWDCRTGMLDQDPPLNVIPTKDIRSDGRQRVIARGNQVQLVPTDFEEKQTQQLQQQLKRLLPTPHWHEEQARQCEQTQQWFAAAFHWKRLRQMQPWRIDVLWKWMSAQIRLKTREVQRLQQ